MSNFASKEKEIKDFIAKCEILIKQRSQTTNFEELADQYLGEGEKVEDDIDVALKNDKAYSKEQQAALIKLKGDMGKILDQLEVVDSPQSPQKPAVQSLAQPVPTPLPPPASTAPVPSQPQIVAPKLVDRGMVSTVPVAQTSTPVPKLEMPTHTVTSYQQVFEHAVIGDTGRTTPPNALALQHKSGPDIWQSVKSSNQSQTDQIFDKLKTSGALQNGFRPSFLQKVMSATGDLYNFTNILAPKATAHCLSFKDAAFGSAVGKILYGAPEPRHLKLLTVVGCNNMLSLNGNVAEVVDRLVRVCLIDGEKIISNIHTIRVANTPDPEKKNWIFDTQMSDMSLGWTFGELFLKCDSRSAAVSILFECNYIVKRTDTQETCMVSCGWYSQPLVENNEPVKKGNFEFLLNGGIPLEVGVGLGNGSAQPPPAQKPKKQVSLKNSKEPYMVIKIMEFNMDRSLVDTMPDKIIGCTLHLPAYDFYCDSLISMLGKREHPQWAGRIHNPFLSTFPTVADQPDIMDVIRILWVDANKKLTKQERKDDGLIRTRFISTYLSLAIPALGSTVLGNRFDWLRTLSDKNQIEARRQELGAMLDVLRQNKSPFQLSTIAFRPVDIYEYVLDLQSPYSFLAVA